MSELKSHLFLTNQVEPPAIRQLFMDRRPMMWFCSITHLSQTALSAVAHSCGCELVYMA